ILGLGTTAAWADVDPSFGTNGHVVLDLGDTEKGNAVVVLPDGGIVVAGTTDDGSTAQLVLACYDSAGILCSGFGTGGVATLAFAGSVTNVAGLVRMSDGRLVVAGTIDNSGTPEVFVARFLDDGTLDAAFDDDGYRLRTRGLVRAEALAVRGDGSI